jgi:hypothetical protein
MQAKYKKKLNHKTRLWNVKNFFTVFCPPYPWYIEPPPHGILTPLSMVFLPPPAYLLIRNEGSQNTMGVQFTIQGGQYTMDENWPRGQYTMGVKISYDTGSVQ